MSMFVLFFAGVAAGGLVVWFALQHSATEVDQARDGHELGYWSAMSIVARVENEHRQAHPAATAPHNRSMHGPSKMAPSS